MWLFTIFLTEFSPNPVAPQTEWVEIYNDSQESVNIDNYIIRDSTSSNKQILSGTILPQSYFTFSFDHSFLNNTSADVVKLFDKNNNLIDSHASKPISAGLSFSKQADGTWCPTDSSPNLPNNLCKNSYSLQNSPTPVVYISLKIISIDADKELIEISNDNNFSVSLLDWRLRDNSGTIRKLSCQSIEANSNCTSTFSSGYLNNDTDKITLLDPLKREISIYSYDYSKQSITNPTSTKSPTKIPTIKSQKQITIVPQIINKQIISSPSSSSITINPSSPIHNYLSIILMFVGSLFILSPFIFHGKNNKK